VGPLKWPAGPFAESLAKVLAATWHVSPSGTYSSASSKSSPLSKPFHFYWFRALCHFDPGFLYRCRLGDYYDSDYVTHIHTSEVDYDVTLPGWRANRAIAFQSNATNKERPSAPVYFHNTPASTAPTRFLFSPHCTIFYWPACPPVFRIFSEGFGRDWVPPSRNTSASFDDSFELCSNLK